MNPDETERHLWNVLKEQTNNEPQNTIRIAQIGMGQVSGLNVKQAKGLVRKWNNRELVISFESGKRAMLTQKGVEVEDPTTIE